MYVLDISIETRIFVGIAAMLVLFTSFIIALVINFRRKNSYHRNLQQLMQQKQDLLSEQNKMLEHRVGERTQQLDDKNKELEQSLVDLRITQQQLIQREKLASLGELTAGIAHEIKNPLNFVNNFSEVSSELIKEMVEEVEKGNAAEVKAIAQDLVQNLEKINFHGKRADSIVKGMLAHAHGNAGEKAPTNLNALVDECQRLSYQGMMAKSSGIRIDVQSHLDAALPDIKINGQDIGRVLLNIFSNSFYAMAKKQEKEPQGYIPLLSITTERDKNTAIITIEDNGPGIDTDIRNKIFQPFFTTKPTGEGTGLGLSISYDIITKGHAGEMIMESEVGKFARFILKIPMQ